MCPNEANRLYTVSSASASSARLWRRHLFVHRLLLLLGFADLSLHIGQGGRNLLPELASARRMHEWIQVSLLPRLMERPDKAFWIDAMRNIRRQIEGKFKDTHNLKSFRNALRNAYRENMSLDEYLAAIAEVAGKWGVKFP